MPSVTYRIETPIGIVETDNAATAEHFSRRGSIVTAVIA